MWQDASPKKDRLHLCELLAIYSEITTKRTVPTPKMSLLLLIPFQKENQVRKTMEGFKKVLHIFCQKSLKALCVLFLREQHVCWADHGHMWLAITNSDLLSNERFRFI